METQNMLRTHGKKVFSVKKAIFPRSIQIPETMVLILDGNTLIGAHVRRNLCDLTGRIA